MKKHPPLAVTTSWDDAGPLDIRLAQLLSKYDMPATFYVPKNLVRRGLSDSQVIDLGHTWEIGGHGIDHLNLKTLDYQTAYIEISQSKDYLQSILGKEIHTYAYPSGGFAPPAIAALTDAGYTVGRTTQAFSRAPHQWSSMRTTMQVAPYSLGLTERQLADLEYDDFDHPTLLHQIPQKNQRYDWLTLAVKTFRIAKERGGIWHLWGHSWEVDQFGLWGELESLFQEVSRDPAVAYLPNGEIPSWNAVQESASTK